MLLDLCCTNKGVYIKVGQHVGTLDYLVPHEYVEVLRVLHADAPKSSVEEVFQVLREDLKQEVGYTSGKFDYSKYKPKILLYNT